MKPAHPFRLPALLEGAVLRVKRTVRAAVERSVESLGLAALSSTSAAQRDTLLAAQFELNRKSAIFLLQFEQAYDDRVLREAAAHPDPQALVSRPGALPGAASAAGPTTTSRASTRWDALSLVGEDEMELQVQADRLAVQVAHGCEWELRELDAYVGTLLARGRVDTQHNPLRPHVIGAALMRGVEAVTDSAEVRKLLLGDLARSLSELLRGTYGDVMADLRAAGVQPAGLQVRATEGARRPGAPDDGPSSVHSAHGAMHPAPADPRPAGARGATQPGGLGGGSPMGEVDAQLMSLMRRLAHVDLPGDTGPGSRYAPGPGAAAGGRGEPLPNVIRAHRDELRQASSGSIDHLVIDVVGSLFDQILADPKVPPQMARQIARLQLPVLRAALGDPKFFASRRHPVRRLVNRIASLGMGFDSFEDEAAQRFLQGVRTLVQEIVDGDFDQVELYEGQLAALEALAAEQAVREVEPAGDTARLLARKEDELRLRHRLAQLWRASLSGLAVLPFLGRFLAEVWSQAVMEAARRDGREADRPRRLQRAATELFMSVQHKASPEQRKQFLAGLPRLMQDLNEGLNLIGWPEAERKDFFGQLLPAHAASLKGSSLTTLDFNLLARQVAAVFEAPLPTTADLPATLEVELPSEVLAGAPTSDFSEEEARRIGLVQEAQVDWKVAVDIDLSEEPPVAASDLAVAGLPAPDPAEAPEPTQGAELAEHLRLGFAYRMHLEGGWHKVKLSHVSAGRSFFVFTRGGRHQQAVSLTRRMLVRLCESGRLRAFETAFLLERATARARSQLASLGRAAAA